MEFIKNDENKPRWDLLPLNVIEEVVKVATFGATKYNDNNWKIGLDNPNTREETMKRYFAAAMRHITKAQSGKVFDKESKCRHYSAAIFSLMTLIYGDMKNEEKEVVENDYITIPLPGSYYGEGINIPIGDSSTVFNRCEYCDLPEDDCECAQCFICDDVFKSNDSLCEECDLCNDCCECGDDF